MADTRPKSKMMMDNLIILSSEDGESWDMVLPKDVPDWIKTDQEVIGHMVGGEIAQGPQSTTMYIAKGAGDLDKLERSFGGKSA